MLCRKTFTAQLISLQNRKLSETVKLTKCSGSRWLSSFSGGSGTGTRRRGAYLAGFTNSFINNNNNNNNNNSDINKNKNNGNFHHSAQAISSPSSYWTASQDLALQVAVSKYGMNWSKVTAMVLPEKSALQCKLRWRHLLQSWKQETLDDKHDKLHDSQRLVRLAMLSNFTICCAKTVGAVWTGFTATSLVSEAIHSLMDMINQGLLLVGIRRSLRSPSLEHPYGFHKEQYTWAMISAVGILFIGGGLPIVGGCYNLFDLLGSGGGGGDIVAVKAPMEHYDIAFGVLGLAIACEGFTATKAFMRVKEQARLADVTMREYLTTGSDPASVQVLLEDSSSVLGSLIAASSLGLSWYFDSMIYDSGGSIVIGALLSSVAVFLLKRNMKMVLETSMHPDKLKKVTRVLSSDPVVASIQDIKSNSFGPEHARFKAEISFNHPELSRRYMQYNDIDLDHELKYLQSLKHPGELNDYLTKFGGGIVDQLGDEIDRIEQNIMNAAPEVKHVDLEVL